MWLTLDWTGCRVLGGLNEKNLKECWIEQEVLGPFQRDVDSYVVRCHFLRGIRAGDMMLRASDWGCTFYGNPYMF